MRTGQLDSEATERFLDEGMLLLRGFYDLEHDIVPIQRGIREVIGQVMQRHGVTDTREGADPERFDDGFLDLIGQNRAWGGEVYDAVKQVPAFMRLVAHPMNESLVRSLRPGSVPGLAAGGYGIRIDNPGEDRFRTLWHQEYPAQLRSLDGIVFWSPLVPVHRELGPVQICPGSHREGPLRVTTAAGPGRSGAYALALENEQEVVGRYTKVTFDLEPGDLLLLDFQLLHASGHNRGDRSRWSMQFRYFNFADPVGRGHGWKGSFAAGVDFRSIHPELCVS